MLKCAKPLNVFFFSEWYVKSIIKNQLYGGLMIGVSEQKQRQKKILAAIYCQNVVSRTVDVRQSWLMFLLPTLPCFSNITWTEEVPDASGLTSYPKLRQRLPPAAVEAELLWKLRLQASSSSWRWRAQLCRPECRAAVKRHQSEDVCCRVCSRGTNSRLKGFPVRAFTDWGPCQVLVQWPGLVFSSTWISFGHQLLSMESAAGQAAHHRKTDESFQGVKESRH